MRFLHGPDTLPLLATIPRSDDFSHTAGHDVQWFASFLSLALTGTHNSFSSLQSWTDSPRIKFIFLAHGREEQSQSLKKMEIDRAFTSEICLHDWCLLCHPHPNQNGPISKPCPQVARPCMPLPPIATCTMSGSWSYVWSGGESSLPQFSPRITIGKSPENILVP